MENNSPIGVFDSGIGGLTVLESLISILPNENFIYLADTDYCPYGIKTKEEIEIRVSKIVDLLIKKQVKSIVIACNTATANAKNIIENSKIPIIGVIEPTAFAALDVTSNGNIAVLATNLTIKLAMYQKLLTSDKTTVFGLGCSNFVPLAESNNRDGIETKLEVEKTLSVLRNKNIDTVIYGCTHFGLLDEAIKTNFPNAKIVSCGNPTAITLKERLIKEDLISIHKEHGKVFLYTTGDVNEFKKQIDWFSPKYESINHVKI